MTETSSAAGVDFHCHLDLFPDHEAAIARAEAARIHTLTVTTTPKAWPRNESLTRGLRYVRPALGLHPQLVAERAYELPLWEQYLPEALYVGEVGLDGSSRHYASFEAQKEVFRTVLERCAAAGGKILSVHSVRSASAVMDMVETYLPPERGKVVLHWFTGSKAEARRAAALGCYFSVNSTMTDSERGRALIAALPLNRILTETDGPFTSTGDRPATPADVGRAVTGIAAIFDIPAATALEAILENLRYILGG